MTTNPTHFTPKHYDDAWERADLERNYKDLCSEYTFLSVQLSRATHPFGRERTIHTLLNARLKLEHQLKSLKSQYQKEQAELQHNLREREDEPPTDCVSPDVVKKIHGEIQRAKETAEYILNQINQSPDSSGIMRLMNDTMRLELEKLNWLKQNMDLEEENSKQKKLKDEIEDENMHLHTQLDEKRYDDDKAQLQELLEKSMDECETLKKQVKFYAEALGCQ